MRSLLVVSLLLVTQMQAAVFTVNNTTDVADANSADDLCDTDLATPGDQCSLRAAMSQANASPGADNIEFDIAPAGTKQIIAGTLLPALTGSVTIDGTTQPGYNPSSPRPMIEITDGGPLTGSGIRIIGGNQSTTIRGLVINRFRNGIQVSGSVASAVIQGNYVGTNQAGTNDRGNFVGIVVGAEIESVLIGGPELADRNVICGNNVHGIELNLWPASSIRIEGNFVGLGADGNTSVPNGNGLSIHGNALALTIRGNVISGNAQDGLSLSAVDEAVVTGNIIGLNASGSAARGNALAGIKLWNEADRTRIGGPTAAERNVISGNEAGIFILDANRTIIQGNFIGVNAAGTGGVPNTDAGIRFGWVDTAMPYPGTLNVIGGTGPGEGNVIASNAGAGVAIHAEGYKGNPIEGNAFYRNGGMGIDLTRAGGIGDGPSPNDPGDADTSLGNNGQNYPSLTAAVANTTSVTVTGTLDSQPLRNYRICFYASLAPDSNGFGEGERFLGCTNTFTDASGTAPVSFTSTRVPGLDFITATATDIASSDTSEFSNAIIAAAAGELQFTQVSYSGTEGTAMVMAVERTGGSAGTVTATLSTSHGTADGFDYTGTTTTVTFLNGDTATKTISIPTSNDVTDEDDETFTVTLSSPTGGASIGVGSQATVTILDNDPNPVFVFADATVTEGNGGSVPAQFTVTRTSGTTQRTITIAYATANGSATAPSDYTATSGTLTFSPTDLSKTITVPVNGDLSAEGPETFELNLSAPVNATLSDTQAIGTINDDDSAPTVSIDDVVLTEGTGGTTSATFSVTLSAASAITVLVNYSTANGTAVAGSDYVVSSGSLTFGPGQTVQSLNIPVVGDSTDETDETFTVSLGPVTNASLADSAGLATITDDDGSPTLSVTDATLIESGSGSGAMVFTVTLSHPTDLGTASVDYATSDLTAVAGSDYTAVNGTLSFAPGVTSATISVPVLGDGLVEPNETFALNLSNPSLASISDLLGQGMIVDDDGTPQITIANVTVAEGDGGTLEALFEVVLSSASSTSVSVDAATADDTATAGSDYVAKNATLTFPPGTTSQTFSVTIDGDIVVEANETFLVNLTGASGAAIAANQAVGTIVNDDGTAALSIGDTTVTEGSSGTTSTVFAVNLSAPSGVPVTVNYATANGAALSGTDYTSATGSITFDPGQTSKTIVISVLTDVLAEATESFSVNLSAATGASLADASGLGTIIDDDGTPALSISDATVTEGNSGTPSATFAVTLSAPSSDPVTVSYATADGLAVANSDYTTTTGSITFDPGQTSKAIVVPILTDDLAESTESFSVSLSSAGGASLADAMGLGTIIDDDGTPALSISDVTVTEGNSGTNAVFAVTLSAPSSDTVTVAYATADSSALAGADYTTTAGSITFDPGQTSKTISAAVIGDAVAEPTESFLVNLSGASGASLADTEGTATIIDDDGTPALFIGDATVIEGNSGTIAALFAVTLSGPSSETVTVSYSLESRTATIAVDVADSSGILTFAPGETSRSIAFSVIGDTVIEPSETFVVRIASPSNASLADSEGMCTITNDDGTATLSIGDATAMEGDAGTTNAVLTVSLAGAIGQSVTVNFTTANGSAIAGADYTATSGMLTFPTGPSSQTITIPLIGDTAVEGDEIFNVTLGNAVNATIDDPLGVVTIDDDDTAAPPSPGALSITDAAVAEGDTGSTNARFTVVLGGSATGSATSAVTVSYAAVNGTAIAGKDFAAASGTLTFVPGTTTQTILVSVTGDTSVESTETFAVQLSASLNATIADGSGLGTIVNDDVKAPHTPPPPPTPSNVTIDPSVRLTECTSDDALEALFTVRVSPAAARSTTVWFRTEDGTAREGQDYEGQNGQVVIPAGQTAGTVAVRVLCDAQHEEDETFFLVLTETSSEQLRSALAAALIVDDDEALGRTRAIAAVVGATAGARGSLFRTTLRLFNPTDRPIRGRVVLHPAGRSGADDDPAVAYSLLPGESRLFPNLLAEIGMTGLASADILALEGEVPVTWLRIYSDGGANGTSGFVEQELTHDDALTMEDVAVLFAPADLKECRYNVGLRSLERGTAFDVEVRTESGAVRARTSRSLPPDYFIQMSGAELIGTPLENGDTILITVRNGDLIAYGAMTDNITNDPSVQFARRIE